MPCPCKTPKMAVKKSVARECWANFHINNGGVKLSVEDRPDGAELVIEAHHFGIQTNRIALPITRDDLWELSFLFKQASKMPLHGPRAHATLPRLSTSRNEIGNLMKSGAGCSFEDETDYSVNNSEG